jgi:hypothetical protein
MKSQVRVFLVLVLVLLLTAGIVPVAQAHPPLSSHDTPARPGVLPQPPTSIDLISFTAEADGDTVTLTWETGTETDNAGFNLYRAIAASGPFDTQINDALIAAQGDPFTGATYTFEDAPGPGIFYYLLESVDFSGDTHRYPPCGPVLVGKAHNFLPLLIRPK